MSASDDTPAFDLGRAPEASHRGFAALRRIRASLVPEAAPPCPQRYRLRERLGEGGLGVVYAAYDPTLDREVAIKVLRQQSNPGPAAKRLVREARAMARLTHANVVEVFDFGEQDGRGFLVMEKLVGETLGQWLQCKRSLAEILEVFGQAAQGLIAAHEVGIVHRDFKPANVMVSSDGVVKVLDFGLARAYGITPSAATTAPTSPGTGPLGDEVTEAGLVLGTPSFMAPEQHQGLPADAQSDQYAFCVALFRAVYGVMPFYGETADTILEAKLSMRLPPGPIASSVPRRLANAIARGLSPQPRLRWSSMEALLAAMGPRRVHTIVAASLGAFAVAGLLTTSMATAAPAASSSVAEAPVELAESATSVLAQGEQLREQLRHAESQARLSDAIGFADQMILLGQATETAVLVIDGLHDRGHIQMQRGLPDPAAQDAMDSAYAAQSANDELRELRAATLAISALVQTGDLAAATRWSRTTEALLQRAEHVGQRHAEALCARGTLLRNLGDAAAARAQYERALGIAQSTSAVDIATTAAAQAGIAASSIDLEEFDVAYDAYSDAYDSLVQHLGAKHTKTATVMMNLGIAASSMGKLDEAEEHLRAARSVFVETTAADAPYVAFCDHSLAAVAAVRRDHPKALALFSSARDGFRRAHGERHHTLVRANIGISNAQLAMGQRDQARRTAAHARRMAESLFDPGHPAIGHAVVAEQSAAAPAQ